jgi:hypothetical protein
MATAEKALVDILYLFPEKSKTFRALPELGVKELSLNKIEKWIKKIPSKRRRTLVANRFRDLFK